MKCQKVIYFLPVFVLIILAGIQSLLLETSTVWKDNAYINGFSYYHILTQLPVLLMGMTLFYVYPTLKNQQIARYQSGLFFLISAGIAGYTLHHPIYLGYILHPFLAACAFASLFLLLDSFENQNGTDIPFLFSRLKRFLLAWSKKSYPAYLVHTLFVWYMPAAVNHFQKRFHFTLNPDLLYVILIIPMFFLTYWLASSFDWLLKNLHHFIAERILLNNQSLHTYS